ncbi:hypothetical protein MTO96_034094 [Rhipicephalus appendiculatus]
MSATYDPIPETTQVTTVLLRWTFVIFGGPQPKSMWAARTLLCTARLAASAPPKKAAICWQSLQRQQMTRTANFHTSPKRCIHPIFLIAAKQITKGLAVITGRGFRKWWKALPEDKKAYFISVAVKNKWKIAGYFGVAWGIGGNLLLQPHTRNAHHTQTPLRCLYS